MNPNVKHGGPHQPILTFANVDEHGIANKHEHGGVMV